MINDILEEAAAYLRFSSHSQRDVSIDQQYRAVEQFAARHGMKIVARYEDRAMTGTNDKRPGFQRMIKDAEKATWKYVIVYSLDRFARDRYDSAVYKRQLKNFGVKVLSAMENISDDPSGVLMESLLEGLAEYYSKELSQKIRRGMGDNATRCMVNGSLPLGYKRGEDGRYAIDEFEASVVREVFQRIAQGDRFCEITHDMNTRGILTKAGKPWTKSAFNRMLTNERYTGVYIYGDTRIPGGIPPIVSKELFETVQSKLGSKPNPRASNLPQRRRRDDSIYLLTGKIFCGKCQEPMVGISGHSKHGLPYYYYCCKSKRLKHTCDKQNVPRESIEQTVTAALKEVMLTDEAIEALADAAIAFQEKKSANSEIAAIRNRLSEIATSIKNIMSAIEAGIFTPSTKARLEELEHEQRSLNCRLSELAHEAQDDLTRDEIVAALKMFQHGDVADKSYQEALIDTFLVRVYVYDDQLKFIFNLGGKEKPHELPFNIDDALPDDGGATSTPSPRLHQAVIYEHFAVSVIVIGELFVFRYMT